MDTKQVLYSIESQLKKREARNEEEVLLNLSFAEYNLQEQNIGEQIIFLETLLNTNRGEKFPTLNFVLKCILINLYKKLKNLNLKLPKPPKIPTLEEIGKEAMLEKFLEEINYYETPKMSMLEISTLIKQIEIPKHMQRQLLLLYYYECY